MHHEQLLVIKYFIKQKIVEISFALIACCAVMLIAVVFGAIAVFSIVLIGCCIFTFLSLTKNHEPFLYASFWFNSIVFWIGWAVLCITGSYIVTFLNRELIAWISTNWMIAKSKAKEQMRNEQEAKELIEKLIEEDNVNYLHSDR